MLTLIRNAEIYAPEYLGRCDVLMAGSSIHKIGKNLPVTKEYEMKVVDGTGMYLVPGFIDTHVHILGGGGEGGYHTRTPEIMLTDLTECGITTVLGLLGTDGTTRTMTNLIAKARGLEEEGITTFIYTGSYQIPVRTLTGSVMDDIILLDKVIGTGEVALSDHRSSQPTYEEFCKIVADTRVGGILSGKAGVVNIHMGSGKTGLSYLRRIVEETEIPPVNMVPTHINRCETLFQEGIAYAKECGGLIDFTTSIGRKAKIPGTVAKRSASNSLKRALKAGVDISHITFSSDGQGSMPRFDENGSCIGLGVGKAKTLYQEVVKAIGHGVSMTDALSVVTCNPAEIYHLKGKGRIREGFDADLVLLRKEDLSVDRVYARGRCMTEGGKAVVKGTFE